MQCSAKAVANYFLDTQPRKITHLKLQKLVYISHGWHLGIFEQPLVTDEFAEAWKYGPVFPSLYHEFKMFESRIIDKAATDIDEIKFCIFTPRISENDNKKIELLDKVWNGYGKLDAVKLSELTHAEGTPWSKAWNKYPGLRNINIDNKIITEHYKEKLMRLKGAIK